MAAACWRTFEGTMRVLRCYLDRATVHAVAAEYPCSTHKGTLWFVVATVSTNCIEFLSNAFYSPCTTGGKKERKKQKEEEKTPSTNRQTKQNKLSNRNKIGASSLTGWEGKTDSTLCGQRSKPPHNTDCMRWWGDNLTIFIL